MTAPARRETWPLLGIFCAALLGHFYLTTANWNSAFMPGHEFRQTQTALVAYYIDQQDNFSLRYETPLFGKPWVALPLEVPLYEWAVVGLSRATGLPHFKSARSITLACFYLTLPALYLLLGRLGISRPRRLLGLALVLTCPVYIFYSRAFLIDSMELMASVWFLVGFVRTLDERRWVWLAGATVAGTVAALIKNTTFAVWLLPAAGYTVWLLIRELRARTGWGPPLRIALWALGCIAGPLAALKWWLGFSDLIKAAHSSTYIFTAKNLSTGNFGLLDLAARLSRGTWEVLLARWHETIMPPWLIGLLLVTGLVGFRSTRGRVLLFAGLFVLSQSLFPFAFAYQDYYFYACSIYLMAAFSYVLYGALDSGWPGWLRWLVVAVPLSAQVLTYWHGYRPEQIVVSKGGSGLTDALLDITPRGSVFVIAGNDWAGIVPYYSQHKALMIRNGLENDGAYLDRAFADLDDEDVAAVILMGEQRTNREFLRRAQAKFHLDDVPTFSHPSGDVYFSRFYRTYVIAYLKKNNPYDHVTVRPDVPVEMLINQLVDITPGAARTAFVGISPGPFRARFGYGFNRVWSEGNMVLSAHPDSDLWLHAPARATVINWDYGLHPTAYERDGDKSNGVVFSINGETADGKKREVYRRLLDPARNPRDRGRQHEIIPYRPRPGETLIFSTRPNQDYAYDWAYWVRIVVK